MKAKGTVLDYTERRQRRGREGLDILTAETDAEFESAFDALLERVLRHLEKNSRNFATLDEVALTAVLAGSLDMTGLVVLQEGHSNGHVDLTVEVSESIPLRRKLGEAKIHNGPQYHFKGLRQLLGRYSTGRECRGLMIEYVRKRDIKGLIAKIRQRMDEERPLDQQGETVDHVHRWSFRSTHGHSSGEDLEVAHVGCNLYHED